jgi:Fe-S cluster biogenesis protein NfuA
MTTEEVLANVLKALEEIRPFLNSDGGDISLVEIEEDKHVKVRP